MYPRRITAMMLVLFSGCTGVIYPDDGGDDGGVTMEGLLIDSVSISGSTKDDCSVSIGDVADTDGIEDQSWNAEFFLDDGAAAGSWPRDDGSRQSRILMVKATRKSDGQVLYKKITVTLYQASSDGS